LGQPQDKTSFFLAVLPLAAVYFAALAIYAVSGKWAPPRIQGKTVTVCIAIAVIAFGVVRNLPGMELLAPKVLP
jgi:hypothetical protein